MQALIVDNKSCKIYFVVDQTKVYFNADFDSGNVQKVQQVAPYVFKVHPGFDKQRNTTKKTFFHFKVYGLKMCTANFIITRANIIQRLIGSKDRNQQEKAQQNFPEYHPVYRRPNNSFQKVTLQVRKYYNFMEQPELSFSFQFSDDPYIEFAFSYPYSYEQCQNMISSLKIKYQDHPSIYFQDEILCRSQQKRNVHLITLTQRQNCQPQRQQTIDQIFPQKTHRPFKVDKPVVLLTARVHPGQSPASYSIEGALKFLLNQRDCRSLLLRKNFLFIIIPMINPDGVFHGMFRTDMNGQNLNRIYNECSRVKHVTIWSIKQYALWLSKHKNVLFYFDFHAHPSTKNFFIYGNSFNDLCLQTQAQLFGKMIESNCPYFQNFQSIYSQRQMKIRHKNDNHSKQGCARVFMQKLFKTIHSYTVQCGYLGSAKLNKIQSVQLREFYLTGNYIQDSQFQSQIQKQYTCESYMLMGKSILITILDLFGLNPFPKRIKNQTFNISQVRKSCGNKIYQEVDTYKMLDANSYKKLNILSSLIQEVYYDQKLKGTNLRISTNANNNLLKEQLMCLNVSPKSKILLNNFKMGKSISNHQLRAKNTSETKNSSKSHSKIQQRNQQQRVDRFPILGENSLTPFDEKAIFSKKFMSKSQLFQQIGNKQKSKAYGLSDCKSSQLICQTMGYNQISPQKINSSKTSLSERPRQNLASIVQKRIPSYLHQAYTTTLQLKQFIPDARQSKIQCTLQKSLSLRKGSLSKIVVLKKEELKLLRLSNFILKKIQHQPSRSSIQKKKEKSNNILPSLKDRNLT